jgi:hypothetical protein
MNGRVGPGDPKTRGILLVFYRHSDALLYDMTRFFLCSLFLEAP